jgi:hypothetical protein
MTYQITIAICPTECLTYQNKWWSPAKSYMWIECVETTDIKLASIVGKMLLLFEIADAIEGEKILAVESE